MAGRDPLARRGVVQGVGEFARLHPRAPLGRRAVGRRGAPAGWRAQRAVVLRARRRLSGLRGLNRPPLAPEHLAETVAATFARTPDGRYAITSHSGCLICAV